MCVSEQNDPNAGPPDRTQFVRILLYVHPIHAFPTIAHTKPEIRSGQTERQINVMSSHGGFSRTVYGVRHSN